MSWRQPDPTINAKPAKHAKKIRRAVCARLAFHVVKTTINAEIAEYAWFDKLTMSARPAVSAGSALYVVALVCNGSNLPRIERFQEAARRLELELRILRLDAQEEAV